jgi:hypothetical protein
MVITSAVFQATLDILVPGTILRRVIWSKTMVTTTSVSSCVVSFVCSHCFEVIAVEQLVLGFADWTRRDFGWLRVGFGLTLRITPWLTPLRGVTPLRKLSTF